MKLSIQCCVFSPVVVLVTDERCVGIVVSAVETRVLLEALGLKRFAHLQNEIPVGNRCIGLAQNNLDGVAEGAVGLPMRRFRIRRSLVGLTPAQQDAHVPAGPVVVTPPIPPWRIPPWHILRCRHVMRSFLWTLALQLRGQQLRGQ